MNRKSESKEALLQAAEAVVVQAGAAHLTLDAVAEKAGVSKGGLLYHFPSKEALLQGMVTRLLEQCDRDEQKFVSEIGATPTADLEARIRLAFQEQPEKKQVSAALLAAGANNPKLLEPVREWYRRSYQKMAKSKRNSIRAAVIMMALDGVWLNQLLGTSPLNAKEKKQLMQELVALARSAT